MVVQEQARKVMTAQSTTSNPDASQIQQGLAPGPLPVSTPRVRDRASLKIALGFQLTSIVLDLVSVFLAFWIGYLLRYQWHIGGRVPESSFEPFSTFVTPALAASALMLVIFPTRGVYQIRHRLSLLDYVPKVAGGYAMVISGVVLLAFFAQFTPSRLVYIYSLFFGLIFMFGHRVITSSIRTSLLGRGIGVDRVLIVGNGENARRLMQAMFGQVRLGYQLVGYIADPSSGDRINVATEHGVLTSPRLGSADDVGELVKRHRVDEVIIVGDGEPGSRIEHVVHQCRESVVQFRIVPDLLQISMDRVDISEINGVPTIGVRDASISGWNAIMKRTFDILLSAGALLVFAIPMLVIAGLIRRDSEGGVFYTQTRLGQYGKPFKMIKFRCMVSDADQQWTELVQAVGGDGRIFKDPNDPRLTKVGKHLRKLSLDELPQLWNIVRGDMSLIGPRPPLPKEVDNYESWQKQRLLVRPGLTGLWQVNGRSDLSFDEMVHLDLYYAENWTAWLDVKILLRTIPAVLLRRGAY
jgi:exopolysaccharide biosynthesis polyprenyl glycosylphosphotransferase